MRAAEDRIKKIPIKTHGISAFHLTLQLTSVVVRSITRMNQNIYLRNQQDYKEFIVISSAYFKENLKHFS